MAEAIWNTCFDISDKTKDNVKARQDMELLCNRVAPRDRLPAIDINNDCIETEEPSHDISFFKRMD